jgi:chitin disaccharide deacetylase
MTLRLIINADDYGLTTEVSRGIRDAHTHGIVTSTTCMLNMPTVAADIAIALRETPRLGLGVHLVLTAGRPLSAPETVPSLCAEDGRFLKLPVLQSRIDSIDPAHAEREWRAQIAAFVAAAGRAPTHLDSHHHSSYFSPALFKVMLELARELNCAIRLPGAAPIDAGLRELLETYAPPCTDTFSTGFYADGVSIEHLAAWIASVPDGVHELMTHPGYCNAELESISSYARPRDREREVLTAPEIQAAVRSRGAGLISFAALTL